MNKTNFYICKSDTIQEIRRSFSHIYPDMQINFFSNPDKFTATNSCVKFSPEVSVRDISPDCTDGYISLDDATTAPELEKLIQDNFKLHAEISSGM